MSEFSDQTTSRTTTRGTPHRVPPSFEYNPKTRRGGGSFTMPVFVDSSRCMQENSDGEVETREGSAATERCLLDS